MKPLHGKTIVITGAGRGIGQAVAWGCAEQGANLCLASRTESEVFATAREIADQTGVRVEPVPCDVSDFRQVSDLFVRAEDRLGNLHGLVCAAGIYGPIGPLEENDPEVWRRTIEINLLGSYACAREAIPRMKRGGGGRIVFFSGGGQGALPNFSAYVTSKGGIWRLCETLGAELEAHRIYVNAIAPGAVNTKLLDDLLAAGEAKVGREMYQKSLRQKEEGGASPVKTQQLVHYLMSDKSAGLTGKVLSSLWDPYSDFADPAALSRQEIYTMRRVTAV